MKKSNCELNSIFAVAEEMKKNNGEDCFYYETLGDSFIIASLDGCGGSGAKKYENYFGKTGAYMASRGVCGGIREWFLSSGKDSELPKYINKSLDVLKKYADKAGRILGTLGKSFPTTASVIKGDLNQGGADVSCYWAGDSRCYMLDATGLYQLTEDDLDGQDAMSNLTEDGVMTNVVNASTPFDVHKKAFSISSPCIFITATDGCFGYLHSPMEFEYLLTDSLIKSKNILEWKKALNERMHDVAGDDYTLCVAICGYKDFADIKKSFTPRSEYMAKYYINTGADVNALWNVYKKEYSKYL